MRAVERWPWVVSLAVAGLAAAAVGCARHVPPLVLGDGNALDVLGALLGLLGVALIVAAFVIALRGRRRRWRLAAVPVLLLLAQFYVLPVTIAVLAMNADRVDVAPASSLGLRDARDVVFSATDGPRLAGWYVPGRGHAAVVLAHGSHGSRRAVVEHLQVLTRLGYGVLAFDARGHGESAGDANALGWRGEADINGAIRFLRSRPGVDEHRVGVVGLSMGGEEALRAASGSRAIAAVVADGAGASTTEDSRAAGASSFERTVGWIGMRAIELLSDDAEPAPLVSRVGTVTAPVLLIASNADGELDINREFARRIGPQAQLWHVDADHTEGLDRHPGAYARRLRAFLASAL
jgi:uncharacterized protein